MSDFIPGKEADKREWCNNLKTEVGINGATLGLSATEITDVQSTCTDIVTKIDASNAAQTAAKTAKTAKDTSIATGEKKLRLVVKKMKSSTGYTETLGTKLRIIGDDPTITDYTTYKPTIKATVMPARVRIDFVKDGLDGVNIYARLKGQSTWVKLAYDSYSPYEDTRPLAVANTPEHREYMAIGVIHDEEVTQQSDIIEAVFGG
ncbi:MAG: hypothetical protein NTZ59_10615 [Bacteroidetes bacterium]|nr:hypothetical protein [Bacteroidota bacterium]